MPYIEFIWDSEPGGNVEHCADSGVSIDEIEQVMQDPRSQTLISRSSNRPITFGVTAEGRTLAVVWEELNSHPLLVYVRTAVEPE